MNSPLLSRKLCVIELLTYVREERNEGEVIMTGAASREGGRGSIGGGGKLRLWRREKRNIVQSNEYGGNKGQAKEEFITSETKQNH